MCHVPASVIANCLTLSEKALPGSYSLLVNQPKQQRIVATWDEVRQASRLQSVQYCISKTVEYMAGFQHVFPNMVFLLSLTPTTLKPQEC